MEVQLTATRLYLITLRVWMLCKLWCVVKCEYLQPCYDVVATLRYGALCTTQLYIRQFGSLDDSVKASRHSTVANRDFTDYVGNH